MSSFENFRLHFLQLDAIDWKHFDFPRLAIHRHLERNGQNEIEDTTTVRAVVAAVPMPDGRGGTLQTEISLYTGSASARTYVALLKEVAEFNSDTEKHWMQLLTPLIENQIESERLVRKEAKKREKKLRKVLDRLLGLDIRYTG